eukprot:892793-Ditylum_brightwellii.AAC.1
METSFVLSQGHQERFSQTGRRQEDQYFIPSDAALSASVTKQDIIKTIISKANEKQEHQIIAYIFQDLLSFPPTKMWVGAVNALKISLNLNKNQEAKVYHAFNCCEDEREKQKIYDGERNKFFRVSKQLVKSNGIEGQIIPDVLQSGGNLRGVTEV